MPFYTGDAVHQGEGKYDYAYIDKALGYLQEKGITPKGHPLWFGHKEVNAKWLFDLDYPHLRKAAADIARHHVSTYKGVVDVWDSMNEAHDRANCFELNQEQLIDLTRATTDALREANDKATSIVNICLPFAEYVAGRYNCYGALPKRLRSPLIEPSFSGNGAFLYEDENPREMYFRLLALKERIVQR